MASHVFDNFSGGDWGRLGADKAAKNQFSATNMIVYRTGELGVRAGVRLTNPTGMSNGVLWGMGTKPGAAGSVWFGQGTAVHSFTPQTTPGAVATAINSLTGSPADVFTDETGTTTYFATNNRNGYSFNGTTLTSLNNMPHSDAIALLGDRLVAVPTAAPNTLRYSDAASFNSWPVANTITVGDTDPITAIYGQRGHLAILKKSSSFYILTGVPGVNDTLRPVYRFDGPISQNGSGRTRSDDRVWFAPTNAQHISAFDGTRVQTFDQIAPPLYSGLAWRSVVPFRDDDTAGAAFVVPANTSPATANEVWLRSQGIWTKHTFGVAISDYAGNCFHGYPQDGDATPSSLRYGTCLVFSDGGDAGATPNFWSWQPFTDRPGLEADPFTASAERAGDASTTQVTGTIELPYVTDDIGRELLVRKVTVHFRSWDTGGASTNNITATVRSLREYDGTYSDSTALSWTQAGGSSSTAGTLRRTDFYLGDQGSGSAFQIRLSDLRGVAIRRIVVDYDVTPRR